MKMKVDWSKVYPHVIIVGIFVVLAVVFCAPILEGKTLIASDLENWSYMAKEASDFNARGGEPTYWTNSMFGGMPTYQITASSLNQNNILPYIASIWHKIPFPAMEIFLYLLGAYILFLCFRLNKWLAFIGAIALTFISYNVIILVAGHVTKARVIAYIMPLIGGVYVLFRRNKWYGMLLTAFFLGLAIWANHLQILYYTLYIILVFAFIELIYAIREKRLKPYFLSVGLGCIALIIALGLNAPHLLTTYEYSKTTMRGMSNGLESKTGEGAGHGLSKDYITQWSYGIGESFTLLVPDFKGGASHGLLSENSETAKALQKMGVHDVKNVMKEFFLPLYWGNQPFTSGPVYLGAIVCFLFVLGLFLVENRLKWWLVSVTVLTLLLAWGKNFMPLTEFFIDYVPLYNKFRAVSMMLMATCLCMGILGFLGLKAFLSLETDKKRAEKALKYALFITGGLTLLFWLIPSLSGNFVTPNDQRLAGNYQFLQQTLPSDRMALLRHDAFRSFVFIFLFAAALWLFLKSKLKLNVLYMILGVLILGDMWTVGKRYLNESNFEKPKNTQRLIQPSLADRLVLKDTTYYRVLSVPFNSNPSDVSDISNVFNDARAAYFHKSIGGYHAAKLSRYQELIDNYLYSEIQRIKQIKLLHPDLLIRTMQQTGILNMLNMKYLIFHPDSLPFINPEANGNAWFIDTFRLADNANEEMELLGEIDTKRELVVDKRNVDKLPLIEDRDTMATIRLKSYAPNRLLYEVDSRTEQIAVFSEIYYDKGWVAYVDGEQSPYFRANYLLRAMPLKAGRYEVEFRFQPKVVKISMIISLISSILLILSAVGIIYWQIRRKRPAC